jgi:NAD(P)-dependent dehydrogenase (short-subunit alcohol dehydrogenase family)
MSDALSVLVIGPSGTIGNAACVELEPRHKIIKAGRHSGDIHVDVTDPASIEAAFDTAGPLDAVIVALGQARFAPLSEHKAATLEDSIHRLGIHDKLMGQINVAYCARDRLNDNGSITLTTGLLNWQPVPGSISPSMVNGALDAFVTAAAMEMPRGIRLNAVSPTVLTESLDKYGPFFRGVKSVPAADVGLAYSRCVESLIRGQVLNVGW